jgi:hypothetical protein
MLLATQKIKKEMSVNIMWKSWGTEDELSTPAKTKPCYDLSDKEFDV